MSSPEQPEREKGASDVTDEVAPVSLDSDQNGASNTSFSPLEEKIIRQIEYYFGDRNMPRDKFLQQAANSGQDGYVPIATLLTFNRLKALSSNEQLIAAAVKKSGSSIVQLNDEGTGIRRHPDKPLPDIFSPDLRKFIKSKTVYVKGFPLDSTLDNLQSFFVGFGKIEHLQMRRKGADEGRQFKGSVFVEFTGQDAADAFLALKSVKFGEVELMKESKENYFQKKNEEKKFKTGVRAEQPVVSVDVSPRETTVKQTGCVLHFNGCGDKPTWEAIKERLSEYATVAFVDFPGADRSEGYVRFKEEGGANKALEGLRSGLSEGEMPVLLGAPSVVRVLKGEEEVDYWAKMEANKKTKMSGAKGQKRKYKHYTGHRAGKPPAKQLKTED